MRKKKIKFRLLRHLHEPVKIFQIQNNKKKGKILKITPAFPKSRLIFNSLVVSGPIYRSVVCLPS